MENVGDLVLKHAIQSQQPDDIVNIALKFVRKHFDMEAAYLSEFVEDDLVFRMVDAPGLEDIIDVGGKIPLDQVYCRHILEGRLPELIPDTDHIPFAQTIPITHSLPIRSHVSVPIKRADGSYFGMFCCLSRHARPSLNARDLEVMRVFANLSSDQINTSLSIQIEHDNLRSLLNEILKLDRFDVIFQPIFAIQSRFPTGFEALTRFQSDPYRAPNLWFDDAANVNMQTDLEIATIEKALRALNVLPTDIYISVNASPLTVQSGRLEAVFADYEAQRIVLEITEHAAVHDYETLLAELEILRTKGIRLAVDDAGAGYSGLQNIVQLQPDIIKLDMSLTTQIDKDLVRKSLSSALVRFAGETGAMIVAEGIETEQEFETLQQLSVDLGQGYLLGRPASLGDACSWFQIAGQKKA